MKKGVGADVVQQLEDIYAASISLAKEILETGEYERYCDVVYPKLIVKIVSWHPVDRTEPFGYVDAAGCYSAVLSKPELIHDYLCEQLERLCANYECVITVEPSTVRIPPEYIDGIEGVTEARRAGDVAAEIPRPTLDDVDDAIIDGEWDAFHGEEKPLFHFTPQRFDIACARIQHYTGISPASVQKLHPIYKLLYARPGICELWAMRAVAGRLALQRIVASRRSQDHARPSRKHRS